LGLSADVTAGIDGIGVGTTIPPAFTHAWSQSESFTDATSLYTSKSGMTSMAQGNFIRVEINSNFRILLKAHTITLT